MRGFYRISNAFENLRFYIASNRNIYLSLLISFLLGVILGIGFNIGDSDTIIIVSASKHFAITDSISIGSVFLQRIFTGVLFCFVMFVASFSIWLCPVIFIGVLLQGYLFGGLIMVLVSEYAVTGIIVVACVLIPCQLLWGCFIINICAYSFNSCLCCRRFGFFEFRINLYFYLKMLIINLLCVIIELILIALIANALLF